MDQDLSDARWELIRPLLPAAKRRGRPRAEDRRTLNGILHVLRSSCRWQDMPRRYDSSVTCWKRLAQWQTNGTWEGIWRAFLGTLDSQGKLDWTQAFLDGTFAPAKKGDRKWASLARAKAPR